MAHNFRVHLRADLLAKNIPFLFVSKAGGAGQPGTPDAPLSHPDQAAAIASPYTGGTGQGTYPGANTDANKIIVIGTGEYHGQLQASSNLLVADGTVLWNVNGDLLLGTKWDYANNHPYHVQGITFRSIQAWRPNYSGGGVYHALTAAYQSCSLLFESNAQPNVFSYGGAGQVDYPYTLRDCIVRKLHGPAGSFVRSLLLDTYALDCWQLTRCYVDPASRVELRSAELLEGTSWNAPMVEDVNIQGLIRVKGDAFGYTDIETFKQNYNLTGRADLFSAPPLFGSVAAEDYSVRPGSPNLSWGIGPLHLQQGSSLLLEGPEGDVTGGSGHRFRDSDSGLVLPIIEAFNLVCKEANDQKRLLVKEGVGVSLDGWYKTGLHFVSDTSQEVRRINYLGGLRADTDFPTGESLFDSNAPEPANTNVPSHNAFTTGAAGRNPHRLDFLLRWGNKSNPDATVDADFVHGGQYLAFEWFSELLYNPQTLKGTGEPDFDPAATGANAPRYPHALYLQYWVRLRNNYYSR